MKVNDELKYNFLEWLRPKGIDHLKKILKEHKTLNTVLMEDGIPWPVHFREGMQIRNWMRTQEIFTKKDSHWLDNNWEKFTKECLK